MRIVSQLKGWINTKKKPDADYKGAGTSKGHK